MSEPIMYMDIDSTLRCVDCKNIAPKIAGLSNGRRRHTPITVKWGKSYQCEDCSKVIKG